MSVEPANQFGGSGVFPPLGGGIGGSYGIGSQGATMASLSSSQQFNLSVQGGTSQNFGAGYQSGTLMQMGMSQMGVGQYNSMHAGMGMSEGHLGGVYGQQGGNANTHQPIVPDHQTVGSRPDLSLRSEFPESSAPLPGTNAGNLSKPDLKIAGIENQPVAGGVRPTSAGSSTSVSGVHANETSSAAAAPQPPRAKESELSDATDGLLSRAEKLLGESEQQSTTSAIGVYGSKKASKEYGPPLLRRSLGMSLNRTGQYGGGGANNASSPKPLSVAHKTDTEIAHLVLRNDALERDNVQLRRQLKDFSMALDRALAQKRRAKADHSSPSVLKRIQIYKHENESLKRQLQMADPDRIAMLEGELSHRDRTIRDMQREMRTLQKIQRKQERDLQTDVRDKLETEKRQLLDEVRHSKERQHRLRMDLSAEEKKSDILRKENLELKERVKTLEVKPQGPSESTKRLISDLRQAADDASREVKILKHARESDLKKFQRELADFRHLKTTVEILKGTVAEKDKEIHLLQLRLKRELQKRGKPSPEKRTPEVETQPPEPERLLEAVEADSNLSARNATENPIEVVSVASEAPDPEPEPEIEPEPEGDVLYVPEGSMLLPDGAVLFPTGEIVRPTGSIVMPDGSVVTREMAMAAIQQSFNNSRAGSFDASAANTGRNDCYDASGPIEPTPLAAEVTDEPGATGPTGVTPDVSGDTEADDTVVTGSLDLPGGTAEGATADMPTKRSDTACTPRNDDEASLHNSDAAGHSSAHLSPTVGNISRSPHASPSSANQEPLPGTGTLVEGPGEKTDTARTSNSKPDGVGAEDVSSAPVSSRPVTGSNEKGEAAAEPSPQSPEDDEDEVLIGSGINPTGANASPNAAEADSAGIDALEAISGDADVDRDAGHDEGSHHRGVESSESVAHEKGSPKRSSPSSSNVGKPKLKSSKRRSSIVAEDDGEAGRNSRVRAGMGKSRPRLRTSDIAPDDAVSSGIPRRRSVGTRPPTKSVALKDDS
eukprot:Rmarinus@m.17010